MRDAILTHQVQVGSFGLPGELQMPDGAQALVVFAHGSGSSRSSPRNRFVAGVLHRQRLATLLFDLLTEDEAADRRHVFDIGLLARRVVESLDWLAADGQPRLGLGGDWFVRHGQAKDLP